MFRFCYYVFNSLLELSVEEDVSLMELFMCFKEQYGS